MTRPVLANPRPLRAAIYLRLSKDSEASSSVERQRLACLAEAKRRGWEVVLVEEDVDVSASKRRLDRPGLDRLRAAYGDLDVVVFWKVDRLARSIVDFASLMEEADRAGVALVSATEPMDLTTPMGRAMAQVVAIFAEMEARTIGLRMESTIAHLRQVGRSPGGLLPFHLTRQSLRDGAGYTDVLDPVRAPLVREAVERVLEGESLLAIARDWTSRGIPTPRGGAVWSPDTLGGLLRSPSLLGHTVHRGQVLRGDDGLPLAHRPALLDLATFQALQAELDARRRPGTTGKARGWLLGGLAVCGEPGCANVLHARSQKGKADAYVCSARSKGRPCPGVAVSRARLEEYVAGAFLRRFGRWEVMRPEAVSVQAPSRDEVEEVRAALADLEADRYDRGLFRGPEGAERFQSLYGRLETRLAALEALQRPASGGLVATGETFAQAWEREDGPGRRALLADALLEVAVRKGAPGRHGLDEDRLDLTWRGDEPNFSTL